MSDQFVHLQVKSEYSLLESSCKLDKLINIAKEQGYHHVALTDSNVLYGAFQFYLKCIDAGMNPIIGLELNLSFATNRQAEEGKTYHPITLIAKNYEGYCNLIQLSTIANLDRQNNDIFVTFADLKKYSSNLIALSGTQRGFLYFHLANQDENSAKKFIQNMQNIFAHDFYLEILRVKNDKNEQSINDQIIKFSRDMAIPLVASNDVHYLTESDSYAHEVLLCIKNQRSIYEKDRPQSMLEYPNYFFKTTPQMQVLFADLPDALANTVKIATLCHLELPFGKWVLPIYPLPDNTTPEKYLEKIVWDNYQNRIGDNEAIRNRLKYELEIICQKGYATYFLIVADCVIWAKNQGIGVGPGRGSVGGSLVAYVMRITEINPLLYNLPFERFLNPERPTPPDIDLDFADIRRGEVIAYLTQKYGVDNVAQIITFGRMEARMVVRDVNRALGFSYSHGDRIAKLIPLGKQGAAMTIEIALSQSEDLSTLYSQEEDVAQVIDVAKRLEGLARHASVHAAGLIITDKALTNYVPLAKESKGDGTITQFDMYSLDVNAASDGRAIGLLKIDILGLRNLTILEQCIVNIKQTQNKAITLGEIPLDDAAAFELICQGRTLGVFQLESRGMQRLAKDLLPNKITDIIAMVALFRPGPMDLIPNFIAGKKDSSKIEYLHPHLKTVLEETYGVLVYQEQIMDIAVRMANFTLSQADILRMAVGKKKKALMEKVKIDFVQGCIKNGYDKKIPLEIFSFIEKFASYGFNKAHAAAYATISYWTAYMKANFPVEFMCAVLTNEIQGTSGAERDTIVFECLDDCLKLNIAILPPDINTSQEQFQIEGSQIRFGLGALKQVGSAAIEAILLSRKDGAFIGLKDFLWRVDMQKVNKRVVETLIRSGAFDQFASRSTLLHYYPLLVAELSTHKGAHDIGQFGLFSVEKPILKDEYPQQIDDQESDLIAMEKLAIGFSLGRNPLIDFEEILQKKGAKRINQISPDLNNKSIITAGIVAKVKKIITKKSGAEMAFLDIYDKSGNLECVIFPSVWEKYHTKLQENSPLLLKGKVSLKEEQVTLIIEDLLIMRKST